MKKVLALGYLPKAKGGRQLSGLATGIFDLHNAVNELASGVQIIIAATDVFEDEKIVDSTTVLGWSKKKIFFHALMKCYRIPYLSIKAMAFLKYKPVAQYWRDLMKLIFLDYAIDRVKPDYLHLHGDFYALFGNMIWKKNLPILLRLHGINGFDETIYNYKVHHKLEKDITSIRSFKVVTFVTSSICEEWRNRIGSFSCPMIPFINGYNSNVFFPSPKDVEKKYDFITIAGLSERKGQIRVMEAIKKCKELGKHFSYVIVGGNQGDYGKMLMNFAKENLLDVTFTGYLSQGEANEYLWQSKYFIQPSATEGFGKVYIESIGAGVPVILPKHLPIVQDKGILNNYSAIFIDDETTDSIFNCLITLEEYNYDKYELVKSVSHLTWNHIAKSYVKLYN